MRTLTAVLVTTITALFSPIIFADGHSPSESDNIASLSWMTGNWSGAMGPRILEENWTQAKSGSIASLVRLTGPEGTSMVEIVNIQELKDTIVLHIQQWDPGFVARAPAQEMRMKESGENTVTFTAVSQGGLKSLTYSRPAKAEFEVAGVTADEQNFTIKMSPIQ